MLKDTDKYNVFIPSAPCHFWSWLGRLAMQHNKGTCVTPNLTHLLPSYCSASPGQCLLSGDKGGRGVPFYQHVPNLSALPKSIMPLNLITLVLLLETEDTQWKSYAFATKIVINLILLLCKHKDWSKATFYMQWIPWATTWLRLLEKVTSPSFIFIFLVCFTGWFIMIFNKT